MEQQTTCNDMNQCSLERQITASGDAISQIKIILAAFHDDEQKTVLGCLDNCYRKGSFNFLSTISHLPDNEYSSDFAFQLIEIFRNYIDICSHQSVEEVFRAAEKCHRFAGKDLASGLALEPIETYLCRYPEDIDSAIMHCEHTNPYGNGSPFLWWAALRQNVKANWGKFLSWMDNAQTDGEIVVAIHTLAFVPEKTGEVLWVAADVVDRIIKWHTRCHDDAGKGALYRANEAWRKVVDRRHLPALEEIARKLLNEGNPMVLHWAAQEASFSGKTQAAEEVDALLSAFSKIDPQHKGSVGHLSFYLRTVMGVYPEKVLSFMETYCLDHSCTVTIFDGAIRAIANCDETLRNKYLTRWLASDSVFVARNVQEIASGVRPDKALEIKAVFASSEEGTDDFLLLLFYRAIGWLYLLPETCVGFLISCACQMRNIECLKSTYSDFFYLVVVNYLDEYRQALNHIPACKRHAPIYKYLRKLALDAEEWWKRLDAAGKVPELYPSIRHKELHAKRQAEIYGKVMEEAHEKSFLSQIAHDIRLLHGRGSITPVYTEGGENLQESLLHRFNVSVRISRLTEIEGHTLEIRLRELRRARWEEET